MFKNSKKIVSCFLFALVFMVGAGNADAAKFSLSPDSQEFNSDCEVAVNIIIDTEGASVSAADALIEYNSSEITIVDQNLNSAGIQVRDGNVFDVFPGNIVNTGEEKIYLTGFNMLSTYKGTGTYGTIIFKGKPGVTSTTLNFDYSEGSTLDSNIANLSSVDILNGVSNGSYTFVDLGYCTLDTTPPSVTNAQPTPSSTGNPLNSDIVFELSDAESGVDIDSVEVAIDGAVYDNNDSQFIVTGSSANYSITVSPDNDFLPSTPVFIEIDAVDVAGNVMTTYEYTFNQPTADTNPPVISGADPAANDQDVVVSSNLVFHVTDDVSGVDIDTLIVAVDGTEHKKGDSTLNFSGNPNDYFVTIDPASDFAVDTPVNVEIDAVDVAGNVMTTYSYSFNNPDQDFTPPYVVSLSPSSGASAVPVNTNLSFHIKDNVSGVNINSVVVKMDGVSYNSGSFTFSGEQLDYFVNIDPASDLPTNKEITVEIDGVDLRGNVMSTYVYKFNKQAICGDNRVELGEECEPPGTAACSEDCKLLICEVTEEIVEDEGGEETPDVSPLAGFLQLSDQEEDSLARLAKDSDGDGLSDVVEERYGTDSNSSDSDGDGISDLEEILDLGSDPNSADVEELSTRIVNWKDGDVTGNDELFIKGTGHGGKDVRIFATSTEGVRFFLGEAVVDDENKFVVFSDVALEEDEYLLIAESYEDNGEYIDESEPIRITLDFEKALAAPRVESLGNVPFLDGIQLIITDNQPVVFGSTVPDSQVFVVFESSIVTSTILSDSRSGFFTVFAPKPLELGKHRVTVYAVNPDGVTSDVEVIEFEITEKPPLYARGSFWIWVIVSVVIVLILAYLWYRHKKKKEEEEKKKLLEKSIVDKGVEEKKK